MATTRRDFIYVKYGDALTVYRHLNLRCGGTEAPSSA